MAADAATRTPKPAPLPILDFGALLSVRGHDFLGQFGVLDSVRGHDVLGQFGWISL